MYDTATRCSSPVEKLPTLREAEDLLIDDAMRQTNGNQSAAAVMLGISHQALNRRLHQRRAGPP